MWPFWRWQDAGAGISETAERLRSSPRAGDHLCAESRATKCHGRCLGHVATSSNRDQCLCELHQASKWYYCCDHILSSSFSCYGIPEPSCKLECSIDCGAISFDTYGHRTDGSIGTAWQPSFGLLRNLCVHVGACALTCWRRAYGFFLRFLGGFGSTLWALLGSHILPADHWALPASDAAARLGFVSCL